MRNQRGDAREAGFTLIEVLVAFVVSAILLTSIFAASGFAAARTRSAHEQLQALMIAQSAMERSSAAPYHEGDTAGHEGPFTWISHETALARDPRGLLILSRMSVEVRSAVGLRIAHIEQRKLKRLAP